jgi:hypothetical protein
MCPVRMRARSAVHAITTQLLVLVTLMRPLYVAALARNGVQAGIVQVVTGMRGMFSLLALSVVGTGDCLRPDRLRPECP